MKASTSLWHAVNSGLNLSFYIDFRLYSSALPSHLVNCHALEKHLDASFRYVTQEIALLPVNQIFIETITSLYGFGTASIQRPLHTSVLSAGIGKLCTVCPS